MKKEYDFSRGLTAFLGEDLPAHISTFDRDPDTGHLIGLTKEASLAILGKSGYLSLTA